jgi:beta-phosphoglucomutase
MIEAVIFDLDGTVLDNEDDWEEAFAKVARKNSIKYPVSNIQLQPNSWMHEPGIGLSANWKRIIQQDSILSNQDSIEELVRETVASYRRLSKSLSLRGGIKELIEKIKEKGWRTALSTSSTWSVVEKELEQLGLELAFDITTTGEEVMMPKPDPEIYLLTAQKLETEPEDCLVIEDAVAGIRAAKEAGCLVTGLVSDYAPEKLVMAAGADYAVKNISDITSLLGKIE